MKQLSLWILWNLGGMLGPVQARYLCLTSADSMPQHAAPVNALSYPWFALVSMLVCSGILGGCMPKDVNLTKAGAVSIQAEAPEGLELSAAAYAESGMLVVYGTALYGSWLEWPVGHVDVEVTATDRTLLSAQDVPYRGDLPCRGWLHHSTFRAVFPAVPPVGATITLRHHHGDHNALEEPKQSWVDYRGDCPLAAPTAILAS